MNDNYIIALNHINPVQKSLAGGKTIWDYWGPEIIKAVECLRAFDLASADGSALAEHLEEALAVRQRHFMLHPVMWFKPEAVYFEAFAALSDLG